jgi:hypothetical protein
MQNQILCARDMAERVIDDPGAGLRLLRGAGELANDVINGDPRESAEKWICNRAGNGDCDEGAGYVATTVASIFFGPKLARIGLGGGARGAGAARNYVQDILSIKRQKGLGDIAAGTRADAEVLGEAWVNGTNVTRFELAGGGYGLTDGARTFRLQYKPMDGVWKANFQENTFITGRTRGIEVKNIHMTITDMVPP